MAEVKKRFREGERGLRSLQELQQRYDSEMWDIDEPIFDKLRHIHIHLSGAVGKLAKSLEPGDHAVHHGRTPDLELIAEQLGPIVADLLIHAAQIGNAINRELGEVLRTRYQQNAARFAPDSAFANLG